MRQKSSDSSLGTFRFLTLWNLFADMHAKRTLCLIKASNLNLIDFGRMTFEGFDDDRKLQRICVIWSVMSSSPTQILFMLSTRMRSGGVAPLSRALYGW
jgi:hypothetical protein